VYHKKLGYILLARDPKLAIPEFEAEVALMPLAPGSQFDLALALEGSGHTQRASEEYRRTLELQPTFPEARARDERGQLHPRQPPEPPIKNVLKNIAYPPAASR